MGTERVDFSKGAPRRGNVDALWSHGSPPGRPDTDPPLQIHFVDPHTAILRQSKAVSAEAPFLYLFLGNDRALLLDTGDTADREICDVRGTVDRVLCDWLAVHPSRPGSPEAMSRTRDAAYELVVAHTHGHHDHIEGDSQFEGRPHTTVVGPEVAQVQAFFGFSDWPAEIVDLDLGGRVLSITGIPGHQAASIAVHDPWSGLLVTGDTVYPGRLYVDDVAAFVDSLDRLTGLASSRRVTAVMGCHLEMSRTPGRDFPIGARHQPGEAPLAMSVEQLAGVRDHARAVADQPGVHRFDDVIIYNGKSTWPMFRLAARGQAAQLRRRASSLIRSVHR